MIDALGRNIEYMRISVTDRCNMRCMYCMPHEGVVWRPHEEMLSYDEIVRLCKIFAALGISKIMWGKIVRPLDTLLWGVIVWIAMALVSCS